MDVQDIRWVRRPGASVAYQVFGQGPELLFIPGFVSNLEYQWQFPLTARFFRTLSSFSRVVAIDRRGCGLSDRLSPDDLPPLEVLVEDVRAIQDAAGSRRSTVFGSSDGGFVAMMFAAMYPERASGLILFGASACGTARPGYPWQYSTAQWDDYLDRLGTGWGTLEYLEEHLARWVPSLLEDPVVLGQAISYYRMAASPSAAVTIERQFSQTDVRTILPSIRVPTTVVHRLDDPAEDVQQARFIASRIPGARLVELPGADAGVPWAGDQSLLLGAVQEHLTGAPPRVRSDRILSTILFTDIVDSTRIAASLGDGAWKTLIGTHDERVTATIDEHGGTLVDTTGDGSVARFDGPAQAIRCAMSMQGALRPLGIAIRAGCHTGEVELAGDRIRGIAVHIAARVSALAGPSEVWVSSTVKDLTAGSGLTFVDAGQHELKGIPERWHLYRVGAGDQTQDPEPESSTGASPAEGTNA